MKSGVHNHYLLELDLLVVKTNNSYDLVFQKICLPKNSTMA
ncbi:unnamed protein product [Arabidopsis halleri]